MSAKASEVGILGGDHLSHILGTPKTVCFLCFPFEQKGSTLRQNHKRKSTNFKPGGRLGACGGPRFVAMH